VRQNEQKRKPHVHQEGGRHVGGPTAHQGIREAQAGLRTVFVGDVQELQISVTVEMCSISASRFGSFVGGEFHDARCHGRTILRLDRGLDHLLEIA
jgi:hypothetical protein